MAFSTGSNGGNRGRRRFGGSNGALSEINIVPLVDVVLVLLIIFMLTAHVMDYGLKVEVPQTKVTNESNDVLPVVVIQKDQPLHLNDKPVNINDLATQLKERFKDQKVVYVAADKSIRWDLVAQVLAELSSGKFEVKMVTKPIALRGR